ncbi:unnamed protein product [Ostreobium quekettii]|uniref:tRNA/rRNA methyltransferase SpoU type domain-containing protein n=1 Tax=Ostreobium quekettii TaxID=121088 RepID=A0A8S1IRI8_9CHLO|nr:unnamed protein product [Ostreobium quekettii]|eukprot:evm.model.scf_1874.1 EVM.evm.TU.scf_1874.1   scf_1874:6737-8564(-)
MGVGAIAEVDMPWRGSWQASAVPRRVLALEGVQDPGNVGTLLRTAVAFGWDSVFLLPGCCDPFNDKALRSGRGAAFQVPLVAGTWDELGAFAKDNQLRCLAAVARTQDDGNGGDSNCGAALNGWWGAKYKEGICLVLGSEGQGLSAESRQYCEAVNIPIGDRMESLNVAVAGGILMFLLRLQ